MQGLKRGLALLLLFSLVFLPLCSEEVYEITESELMAIEENTLIILEKLEESEKKLKMSDLKLQEQDQTLKTLEKQLQIQSESYRKLERDKKLIIKIGIPAITICVAGAFIGGFIVGTRH